MKSNTAIILQDSITAATTWGFLKSNASLAHSGSVSSTVFLSPHHSLAIEAQPGGSPDQVSYYYKSVPVTGIARGSELVLKANLKTVDLKSTATIVLRADSGNKTAAFWTSQTTIEISGRHDFTEYSIKTPYFPEKADVIYIFLLLTGPAGGTVYFDDIQVVNNF